MPDEATPETPAKPPAAATPSAPASPTPAAPSTPAAPASPAAAAATAVAEPAAPEVPKVKPKKATQRACDEKDAKGKLCCGHLKRWYDYPKEIEALVGAKAEVYRCEFCKTLYTPDRSQAPHSYTLRY
jgi:nucleoid-associated protein YgaU